MRGVYPVAILCLAAVSYALAQSGAETAAAPASEQHDEDLRAMEEQRAALQKELERLREELTASEARMAASRERIRRLQSQESSPDAREP